MSTTCLTTLTTASLRGGFLLFSRTACGLLCGAFLAGMPAGAGAHGEPGEAIDEMTQAALAFLGSLDEGQRAAALFEWKDDERENWHFVPLERKGVSIKAMRQDQRALAFGLLGSALSQRGFVQATTIMSLEQVLAELENAPERRDPEKYWVAVFGTPAAGSTWGWRIEGHHLSVNFTIVEGAYVSGTPSFFGANPGEVREGPRKGTRPMAREEDLGRELVLWLTRTGKEAAIFSDEAPDEILSGQERKVAPLGDEGVLASEMSEGQRGLMVRIIREYVGRHRPEFAAADLQAIAEAGIGDVRFAYAGSTERGKGHYYRIQGPTFLLEYANTQNDANHVHAAWRSFDGDFGRDLLSEHFKEAH